jgi:protein-S-isoprenylcysteine O-methyltransferase Ste14
MTVKASIFLVLVLFVFLGFRSKLRSFKSHDFYMFFVSEALLVLLYFNVDFWFRSPFSWHQILSWVFLSLSIVVALSGFFGLIKYGKPIKNFENTTLLVTRGIYGYIRHPLYTGLMFLDIGILLKDVSLKSFIPFFISLVFLVAASKVEEQENLAKFGQAYDNYRKATKNYLPFIF